jgi:hypothetical protein
VESGGQYEILHSVSRYFVLLNLIEISLTLSLLINQMDYVEWNLIISFAGVTAVLIEATGEDPPNVRRASLPQAIVLYIAGGQLFITAAMSAMGLPCPIRLSSTPAGVLTRLGVYVLVEDVCSIDGKGGQEFRKALQGRFGESPAFRRMIAQLNWFWAVGSLSVAIGVTVLVEVVDNLDVVYAIGESTLLW